MLPKKRLEQDREEGIDTLVEGKPALTLFKQSLSLHLNRYIQRELARQNRDDAFSDSDVSFERANKRIATKRRKTTEQNSAVKQVSEQSYSMTFVAKPENNSRELVNDGSLKE